MTKESSPTSQTIENISDLTLGKAVEYASQYAPGLLQGVPRTISREQIGLTTELPFTGEDLWNAYELSWLNSKGKPEIAMLDCRVPYDSPNLIESKSFKLYLNSFNQTKIPSINALQDTLTKDLSATAGSKVTVNIVLPEQFSKQQIGDLPGLCIDQQDIDIQDYELQPRVLKVGDHEVEETLNSNLLKSNCLITNQPDWGSVMIRYKGNQIDKESLLRYLISFRMHNEFHEQCVERIFSDIKHYCGPENLSVYARYTRRGGLDINPFRSDFENTFPVARQARQ